MELAPNQFLSCVLLETLNSLEIRSGLKEFMKRSNCKNVFSAVMHFENVHFWNHRSWYLPGLQFLVSSSVIFWSWDFGLNYFTAEGWTSTKGTMDPEGARLLTYSRICLLCSTTHYAQQAAVLHALHRQCTSEGSMSSFKSITWNKL